MTIPSKREQTHQRIVDVAARALRRNGFAGVGVADVMKGAGLTHGGFYAHFDSREALLVEALEHADAASTANLDRRAAALREDGASPLAALVTAYLSEKHLVAHESGLGCVVGALGSEMARQEAPLREVARSRIERLVGQVQAALEAEGRSGDAAAGKALALAGAMVGALQIARTFGPDPQGSAILAASRQALLAQYTRQPS
ncbi:TetR/AcrR family transcriptional regulator [Massilia sp. CFBP9012]|uniref:TetR/AcrR family transcriptional regulator n=1 Tax=Massilia sp. CFBP9012 TaxID=3096531 RepID=UPI002A6A029D|nr:TetR/AcrR family transcriptional regulator [Massilia sp. CFBP9012]MDY0975563.1 TetR/AcrR family transcriptional regulator [Massilia sp. CFBP9012]